jgi:sodium/potassium-transporting ATPase subunit alpha
MEGFKKLVPQNCKVHRSGNVFELDAVNLVVGDIVEVKAGDKIPADILLIWVNHLKVDNSSLTGESELQSRTDHKTDDNPLETKNIAFFTTLAQEGDGIGVVIRTGDKTIIGTIADLATTTTNEQTPLRREISRFIKIVSAVAISLGIIFLGVGFGVGLAPIATMVFAIGIIVANVPEGLLPTITVGLTLTAKRLAKKKVLVKNLEAVETLGSCSTIASDKTGTLTMNRMTVVHLWYDLEISSCDDIVSKGAYDPEALSFKSLLRVGSLCSRAVFDNEEENMNLPVPDRRTVGDASESAILKFCEGIQPVMEYRNDHPKVMEIPFNSVNKWQLSIHKVPESRTFLLVMKGAPERVIDRCSHIMINGEAVKLDDSHKQEFQRAYETLAGHGERVLAMAELELKDIAPDYEFSVEEENFPTGGLVFVGLVALMDPPKPNVPDAVAQCKQAGIRVIMVTGDHPLTATAIAKQVGILQGETLNDIAQKKGELIWEVDPITALAAEGIVIKGSEIPEMTADNWDLVLSKRQIVFARTSPEQKLQIVEQCQKRGEIVAVTGDGVNDSPALKKADLGCAMGISGSDVSKDAADIILLDDNFASIVAGVREGRIIFDNLKKSINYTLSSNSAELLPFILFVVAQMPLALSAVLILCIDLGTDMVPAISLAYEKPESDIMKRKPRNPKKDRLVTLKLAIFSYLWLGTIQAIAGFIAYFVTFWDAGFTPSDLVGISFTYFKQDSGDIKGLDAGAQRRLLEEAQTAFFIAVVVTRIGCILVCKNRKLSLFRPDSLTNWVLNCGLLVEVVLAVLLAYVPFVEEVFGTQSINWKPWIIGMPFLVFIVVTDEVRKWIIRRRPVGWVARLTYW